jgi:hypothetical protein
MTEETTPNAFDKLVADKVALRGGRAYVSPVFDPSAAGRTAAEMMADAWDAGYDAGQESGGSYVLVHHDNPYRAAP